MLAFTPDVRVWRAWFERTHSLEVAGLVTIWRLVRLPREGGIGDQDAKLMSALDVWRDVSNVVLAEQRAERQAGSLSEWHDRRLASERRE